MEENTPYYYQTVKKLIVQYRSILKKHIKILDSNDGIVKYASN